MAQPVTVTLTQAHFDEGRPAHPFQNPLALAIREALNPPADSKLAVWPGVIAVFHADGSQHQYPLPPNASQALVQLDRGKSYRKITFDIEERIWFDGFSEGTWTPITNPYGADNTDGRFPVR